MHNLVRTIDISAGESSKLRDLAQFSLMLPFEKVTRIIMRIVRDETLQSADQKDFKNKVCDISQSFISKLANSLCQILGGSESTSEDSFLQIKLRLIQIDELFVFIYFILRENANITYQSQLTQLLATLLQLVVTLNQYLKRESQIYAEEIRPQLIRLLMNIFFFAKEFEQSFTHSQDRLNIEKRQSSGSVSRLTVIQEEKKEQQDDRMQMEVANLGEL